jgi:hypothetical protein
MVFVIVAVTVAVGVLTLGGVMVTVIKMGEAGTEMFLVQLKVTPNKMTSTAAPTNLLFAIFT